jgi:hypothetical protein
MHSSNDSLARPALVLDHDDLLLLEALLCFHLRATTSPQLRIRLVHLWERISQVRIASARTLRGRSACAGRHQIARICPPVAELGGS